MSLLPSIAAPPTNAPEKKAKHATHSPLGLDHQKLQYRHAPLCASPLFRNLLLFIPTSHVSPTHVPTYPFPEKARRLVDLVTTSVLLDAGAGDVWKYTEKSTGFEAGRSEGLGVASFHMFGAGAFSSDPGTNPHRADSVGLKGLEDDSVMTAFQVDDAANPLVGCEGRTQVCGVLSGCGK